MTEEESSNHNGSTGKTLLLILAAVAAGFLAIKLTFWAIKWVLVLAVVGVVGYLGYSAVRQLLPSSKKPDTKALPPGSDEEGPLEQDPQKELDAILRELEELKKKRGE
ncbi:MAG: hypothetical protein JW797_07945 [Bradymonadales bacterium]|nr:hypothetical protein [Bradymonadales bacterium]